MTLFDLLLLVVLAVSILFATMRGALREFSTLAVIGLAGLGGWHLAGPLAAMIGKKGSFMAMGATGLAAAGVLFALLYFLSHRLLAKVNLKGRLTTADRIGGGLFGLVRALALIGLGFLGYGYYLSEENQPDAVRRAALLPLAEASASVFEKLAPREDELAEAKPAAAAEGYAGADRAGLKEIVTTVTTSDEPEAPASDDPIADILEQETLANDGPQR
jgi:uncharacterized membrane protein required for colicin V production